MNRWPRVLIASLIVVLCLCLTSQVSSTPTQGALLDEVLLKISTYDYGQSREPLTELSDIVRNAYDSPKELKLIEMRLLKLLRSDATLAGKQFICRKLGIIGTEESVPTLVSMLTETKTSDMARYALERIPGSAVDKALLDALGETRGRVKVGIINSLGERGLSLIHISEPTRPY